MTVENILQEADRLTSVDRQATYGHPYDDYERTAALWSAYLGVPVTAEQAAMCMVLVKVSREAHLHKRDNLVDMAGYARVVDLIHDERARREDPQLRLEVGMPPPPPPPVNAKMPKSVPDIAGWDLMEERRLEDSADRIAGVYGNDGRD